MKKTLLLLAILSNLAFGKDKFKIGATPIPAGEILFEIKDDLAKEGLDIEIIEFTDYIMPNLALDDKSLDANFFQHKPYLANFMKEKNLDLVPLADIYVPPLGAYSKKYKNINDLKNGNKIAIPNDPTNAGRALILLHNNGIIKLSNPEDLMATEFDIIDNPKKLKIVSLQAAQLPRALDDVDMAVINCNYALDAGLSPQEDSLIVEGKESAYGNVVAVRKGDENSKEIATLMKVLRSDKVRTFILEKYKGGIIPLF
ncbi:MetQ/NlpA family ABC transporter substrate-binding protein [Candidatus Cetobacterium colombiensis]|uniref:MetQ/NlpA family ABC transporter substrate-binding protein n=1 Tax=Candidatus Cetobacterium colombiensis TaxID=3073100 RepID=A0ABU4WCA0_9FUSO|nr:MetQ/NlpA family ABC transporter substrate-binding protein [Candidatus Cetobacterium colombiensis]MDX8336186.1 MetQ/NlpA family ABC transporter substrate-binding protein [Candidatus Cetobacterium colombiensis]